MTIRITATAAVLLLFSGLVFAPAATALDWPDNARVAVMLTFDLDAETVWWNDKNAMTGNPSSLSQGRYGPKVALPKILSLLDKHKLRASFFIPSWVAEQYPDEVRRIAAAGHEIGAHGVRHIPPNTLTPEQEKQTMRQSIRTLADIIGRRPAGYRAPAWAVSPRTLGLAADSGFLYSSNLMDSDLPYVHDNPAGLVELPVSWILDDAPYFWFDEDSWNKKIHSAAEVKAIWQEEFVAAYETDGFIDLTMHPQLIGRPGRIRMLDELITWMKSFDHVWFATAAEIAAHVRDH